MASDEASAWVQAHGELFTYLDAIKVGSPRRLVIASLDDELVSHSRDFEGHTPGDYLAEFTRFIKGQSNEIAALKIICSRPASLTREQLHSLRLTLDRNGFTEQKLSSALSQLSNKEMVADIISLVRHYAIGLALVSYPERLQGALAKLKANHRFTKVQQNWLDRIEAYLQKQHLLNPQVFDEDARFRQAGGFKQIDKIFQGQLSGLID